jgi:hypothetical protein
VQRANECQFGSLLKSDEVCIRAIRFQLAQLAAALQLLPLYHVYTTALVHTAHCAADILHKNALYAAEAVIPTL